MKTQWLHGAASGGKHAVMRPLRSIISDASDESSEARSGSGTNEQHRSTSAPDSAAVTTLQDGLRGRPPIFTTTTDNNYYWDSSDSDVTQVYYWYPYYPWYWTYPHPDDSSDREPIFPPKPYRPYPPYPPKPPIFPDRPPIFSTTINPSSYWLPSLPKPLLYGQKPHKQSAGYKEAEGQNSNSGSDEGVSAISNTLGAVSFFTHFIKNYSAFA